MQDTDKTAAPHHTLGMAFSLGGGNRSPEQQPGFLTSTYEENCFQQLQGLLTIPRVC